jgi:hypothetical protein
MRPGGGRLDELDALGAPEALGAAMTEERWSRPDRNQSRKSPTPRGSTSSVTNSVNMDQTS